MKLSDFDYILPAELIAQHPMAKRDGSRLLILDRAADRLGFGTFMDVVSHIRGGDLLVINDTKVIKARLMGKRRAGGKAELFLVEDLGDNEYRALVRPTAKLREGDSVFFEAQSMEAELLDGFGTFRRVRFSGEGDLKKSIDDAGRVPLPPYIKREPVDDDTSRYQTVYADKPGATAAPTAGLHFTREILDGLRGKGAEVAMLTLHVSYGTFAPVKTDNVEDHRMHGERFILSESCAKKVNETKRRGGRVIAVGTTSARTLEACAVRGQGSGDRAQWEVKPQSGSTDLFIYPPYKFKIVDSLLTNFHLPKSTLLLLVSAFAGKERIFKAYEEAVKQRFRFFSYGDCMLII